MNKKSSTCTLLDRSVQTAYPTRHCVESKIVEDMDDPCASWQGTPVARTRLFHPFEYWAHETAAVEYRFENWSANPRANDESRFTQWLLAPGSLRDWVMTLFRQVRGP